MQNDKGITPIQNIYGNTQEQLQQIVLDLHGKLNFENKETLKVDPKVEQTIEALKNFGYKPSEIKKVVPILENNLNLSISELIKLGLKNLY